MHKTNNYDYHTPPHLPPLSVSLPSQTRPRPEPKPKLKLKPDLILNSDARHKAGPQYDSRDFKNTRLEPNEPKPKPQPALTINPNPNPNPKLIPKHKHDTKDLKKTRLEPEPEPEPEPQPQPKLDSKDLKKTRLEPEPEPNSKNDMALVAVVEKYYSPLTSPLPVTPENIPAPPPQSRQVIQFSRREEVPATNSAVVNGGRGVRFGGVEDVARRSKKEGVLKRVGLGIRVLEIVFCLISFSVMAADQTQGWSGDSFYRYKEYRFTLAVAVFGFVYAAFQAYDLGSYIATGKHVITHRFRCQFDFFMDQIIAYLLISASSAAASRVDDWQANWGKDEFTAKASASISMAFLAFICFALSSLISGYNLCNRDLY